MELQRMCYIVPLRWHRQSRLAHRIPLLYLPAAMNATVLVSPGTWPSLLNGWLATASACVWGVPMLVLLVGTGVLLTIRLRGLQVWRLPHALALAFRPSRDPSQPGDISHFQALMTALAATVGTGNIIGVATAVTVGGPGALFWMWVTALFGMATKYAEAILAVTYRVQDAKGEMCGGPMYYLERGLKQKWLGVAFAFFGACAAFGIGNMVQANAVASCLRESLAIPLPASGAVMAVLTALVILGGIRRIGRTSAWLVPIMALVYIGGCVLILLRHAPAVPGALALVLHDAFTGTAAMGGFLGSTWLLAVQKGVSRGLFSNESGLGSAPIAAAAARTNQPAAQALVSMTGTFIDTIVICTLTGLVLIVTGVWRQGGDVTSITRAAFQIGLPGRGGGFVVTAGIVLFAYSTILGWAYYGEKCVEYLWGLRAVLPYRWLWVVAVAAGSVAKLELVWNFSDVMNALMAIPNLIGLIGLSGIVVSQTRLYLAADAAAESR